MLFKITVYCLSQWNWAVVRAEVKVSPVNGDGSDRLPVHQHLRDRVLDVRGPHGDDAFAVAQADDRVVRVEAHDRQTALPSLELGDHLANADVQPTQEPGFALEQTKSH